MRSKQKSKSSFSVPARRLQWVLFHDSGGEVSCATNSKMLSADQGPNPGYEVMGLLEARERTHAANLACVRSRKLRI
jgi:hypothetical protein